jgi:hypothetical protein
MLWEEQKKYFGIGMGGGGEGKFLKLKIKMSIEWISDRCTVDPRIFQFGGASFKPPGIVFTATYTLILLGGHLGYGPRAAGGAGPAHPHHRRGRTE